MKKRPLEGNLWLGFTIAPWLRLLARNRFAVAPRKVPQALLITLVAALNSLLRAAQTLIYGARVRRTPVPDDPIFIIGHWRTGTTMLHELLALDTQHRCPTTYECLSPNHFLLTERVVRRFAGGLLPRRRPFDNMRMGFDHPQEDECALALRGLPSPFLTVAFPRRGVQSPAYIDLDDLAPAALAAWQRGFRAFLQLLLFRRPGRLVLKSPQHTNRIPALLEMFPEARFIHVVRDPYVVFPSTVHFWRTMYEHYGLQPVDEQRLREQVFADFAHMHERLEQTRSLVLAGRFHEVRYEDLTADAVAALAAIYRFLGRDDDVDVKPRIAEYAERSQRYKTNEYTLDDSTRNEITHRWAPYIERHGYVARP